LTAAPAAASTRLVVSVERRGRFVVGEPLFERGPQLPLTRGPARPGEGELALVEVGRDGARPLRVLGVVRRHADVVEALLAERGLERGFAPAVESEAEAAVEAAPAIGPPRRDLTSLATFTVDPATAHDFDDAVSAERVGDGLRLWIHIADVAAYVRPGGALDAEAYARATSTYAPGSVEPMLPQSLSSGVSSLAAGVERLAVTAEIELSEAGKPRWASFYRSRVRSDARLDYDVLDEIFAGRAEAPAAIAEPLALARRAADALRVHRPSTSLTVFSSEPEFEFRDGEVVGARSVEQTEAHSLIEHLMILTNEQVATLLERRRAATLYRVHEQPDPKRIELLLDQLASLDVPTPPLPDRLTPAEAGELAAVASRLAAAEAVRRGHGREAYSSLVLRALKQAYYSPRNLGHAGLGSAAYAHFTSPIRRYPDLVAHRALLDAVGAGEDAPDPEHVRAAGWHSSEREREAARLERDADDVCAAFLLERELFERGWESGFEGEVSGVIGAGAFVRFGGELADVYEGFLPMRAVRGERFELNETETALVGGRSGREIRLGDPIDIRVDAVEAPRGRVDLVPVGDGEDGSGRRKAPRGRGSPRRERGTPRASRRGGRRR
jgi:ribonuclease R